MIRVFKSDNFNNALSEAKKELGNDNFYYVVRSKIDDPECVLETYDLKDVAEYGKEYLYKGIKSLNIESEINIDINEEEKIINISVNSDRNSILIGSGGKTLKAFGSLLRLVISNKFKRKFRIFLDIGSYNDKKTSKIISTARKIAREVIKQRFDIKTDKMSSEKRKIVHQSLVDMKGIKTESVGDDENGDKYIIFRYQGDDKSSDQIHYYKDLPSLDDDSENHYKNEFKRYSNNSFNNFYKENFSKNNYDNEGVSVFTNLSFLKDSNDQKNDHKEEKNKDNNNK